MGQPWPDPLVFEILVFIWCGRVIQKRNLVKGIERSNQRAVHQITAHVNDKGR